MDKNNIVYDILLLEADRIELLRLKRPKLFYENHLGEIVPLAEPWDERVEDMISEIFKRRKMRYMMTFVDGMDVQDILTPSALRMLRFFAREMNYGNVLKGWGLRDINKATGMSMRYVMSAINQLCEHDVVRYETEKGRRTYMVNPIYFYKGSMKSLFRTVKAYERMSKVALDGSAEYENDEI